MIASHDFRMDLCILDMRLQSIGDDEVIDSPSDVSFPGFSKIAPPGIRLFLVRILEAEGIGKSF